MLPLVLSALYRAFVSVKDLHLAVVGMDLLHVAVVLPFLVSFNLLS